MMSDTVENLKYYDVVVVGGGLSGLTAAYQLVRKAPDLRLLILEARNRVGGRTVSVKLKCRDGEENFDMGGQWIAENQLHVRTLVDDLGLELYPRYSQGYTAMQVDGEIMLYTDKKIPLKWMPMMKDFARFVEKFTSESCYVSIENPETSSNLAKFDSMTLAEFKEKYSYLKDSSVPLESMISCLTGCDASQVSVSYFLHYCKAAGGLLTAAGGEAYCVKGGTQAISDELRNRVGNDKVLMDSPVTAIEDHEGVLTVCTTHAQYRCGHVIVSCPPNQIARIRFLPGLSPEKRLLSARMVPGRTVKVMITYQEPFWRPAGLSGCLIAGCSQEPLRCVYDSTNHSGNPALVGFIGASSAIYWGGKETEERRLAVLEQLVKCFGSEAVNYISYHELDWSLEDYTGGGPTYPPSTGVMQYYKCLRQSSGRIHFAGTETATVCCGFMEGAVQSGVRAAKQVLYELRPDAALRTETPLDHITIKHDAVLKPSNKHERHWPSSYVTWCGLALLLVGGSVMLFRRKLK